MAKRNGSTRRWRTLRAQVLAESDVCWICGEPGSDAVDHVIPVDARPDLQYVRSNLRPAHHDVEPKCNRKKGKRESAPMIIKRSGSLARPRS